MSEAAVHSAEYIAEAGNYSGRVHFCSVEWEPNPVPKETVGTVWHNCESGTARDFGAVAYFFGIRLTEALGCPVGLVNYPRTKDSWASGFAGGSGLEVAGTFGYYWSSSVRESRPDGAYNFFFYSGVHDWDYDSRYYGLSVRAVTEY